MKAIVTTYHGPTEKRGSRITAKAEGVHSLTVAYDYALDDDAIHHDAAVALATREGWGDALATGCIKTGIYCHVFI
jgi:hypothetical protein